MEKQRKIPFGFDLTSLIILAMIGLASSLFLIRANFWDTGYQDWMYNAARSRFLQLHGITSWDHVWASGMSYWRGFQFLPSYLTNYTSDLIGRDIPRTMALTGIAMVILYRWFTYLTARVFGARPTAALAGTAITFSFVGFWNVLKDYNIAYGATFSALPLILWKFTLTDYRARIAFAFLVGLSVYLHPLLALCLGVLWFVTLFWVIKKFRWQLFVLEFLAIVVSAWFYAYGLFFLDQASVSNYQLTNDFIKDLGREASQLSPLYYWALAGCWATVILFGKRVSTASKILLFTSSIIIAAIYLNLTTSSLDFLNKLQIIRATFFPAVAIAIVSAECLQVLWSTASKATARITQVVLTTGIVVFCGFLGLYNATTYAPTPVEYIPDPVRQVSETFGPPKGRVFIADSMISSYNQPQYRFVVGYNEHLIPNQLGIRLRELLTTGLNYKPTEREVGLVEDYVYLLGVSDIYLQSTSGYIEALTEGPEKSMEIKAEANSASGIVKVLTPLQDTPLTAVAVPNTLAEELTRCPSEIVYNDGYTSLDACVTKTVDILKNPLSTPLVANYQLGISSLSAPKSPANTTLYVGESYSRNWSLSNGTIERHPIGTIIVNDANQAEVVFTHSWPRVLTAWPYALAFALLVAIALIIFLPSSIFLRKKS